MNLIEQRTDRLCAFFADQPDGIYHPVQARVALSLGQTVWAKYAKWCLYPLESDARARLREIGVTINEVGIKHLEEGRILRLSMFVKNTQTDDE